MSFKTRFDAINSIRNILRQYISTTSQEERLMIYKDMVSLREIFDFFNSAESLTFVMPSDNHSYIDNIGMSLIAWDVYKHDSFGFILGGKGRLKIETVYENADSSVQYISGRSSRTDGKIKISDKTHLIFLKKDREEFDRFDIDDIIKNIDLLNGDPSTSSSK